jgi:hypothetical protein
MKKLLAALLVSMGIVMLAPPAAHAGVTVCVGGWCGGGWGWGWGPRYPYYSPWYYYGGPYRRWGYYGGPRYYGYRWGYRGWRGYRGYRGWHGHGHWRR